jgi:lysozyme family protein
MTFDQAFTKLLGNEGGYTNNPADPGGETNWGITVAVARANGYTGNMQDMTQDQAKAIYKARYWDKISGDQLGEMAFHVFDAAVHSGVNQAIRWLQTVLVVAVDDVIGTQTLAALATANKNWLVSVYNGQRLYFLTNSVHWADFGKGWARRIAKNMMTT